MAIEWTPEKVNACAALYGKLNWNVSVGDRCVKYEELGNDPQNIELINSVGSDSTEFMRGKVWLLTSDDIENILCNMGWAVQTHTARLGNVGGIAHMTHITLIMTDMTDVSVSDSDPHFARLKVLQRVVNNGQSIYRQGAPQEREEVTEANEQPVEIDTEVQ